MNDRQDSRGANSAKRQTILLFLVNISRFVPTMSVPRPAPVFVVARTVHTTTDGTTAMLVLRTFSRADAHSFRAYRSDPETARFQSWEPTTYADEERGARLSAQFCSQQSALGAVVFGETDFVALRGRWLQLALDSDGTHVGDVGILVSPDGRQATIGVTLLRSVTGRGFGRAAVRMALDWLFAAVPVAGAGVGELQSDGTRSEVSAEEVADGVFAMGPAVHRASVLVDSRHERSVHLFEGLGFRKCVSPISAVNPSRC